MRAVVAGHYPDAGAHRLPLGMHVVVVQGDYAETEVSGAGEQTEQYGAAATDGPNNRG
ncbi:hypothetical protein [Mycobacterium uberis]|uniref:hypothetical protein n=1 Tax=Mycobacterium uberis TaxID=2162698 RepID=UPI001401D6C8|nr:hypothetical protein [Mycobacterium uberis]